MNKQTPQQEVAISYIHKITHVVGFYATQDAVTEFADFGEITEGYRPNLFVLNVDRRFDFDEVVEYIKAYGELYKETT